MVLKVNDFFSQTVRDVEVIRLDRKNTVRSLRDQLFKLLASGHDDSGFPILRKDSSDDDGMRLVGYIGTNELEHALSTFGHCFHITLPLTHLQVLWLITATMRFTSTQHILTT